MKDLRRTAGSQPFRPLDLAFGPKQRRAQGGRGNSLLLLQLRTELEGKWRPDKLGIARRWMNVSPKQWFCQKEDVFEFSMRPSMLIRNGSGGTSQRLTRKKSKGRANVGGRTVLMERDGFCEHEPRREKCDKFIDYAVDLEVKRRSERKARRIFLEEEVMTLQKRLYKEMDLHMSLETALEHRSASLSQASKDLPCTVRGLLGEIASLEKIVSDLEKKAALLEYRIADERKEREGVELSYAVSKGVMHDSMSPSGSSSVEASPSPSSLPAMPADPMVSSPEQRRQEPLTLQEHLRMEMDPDDVAKYADFSASPRPVQNTNKHVRFLPMKVLSSRISSLVIPETFARSPLNSPNNAHLYQDVSLANDIQADGNCVLSPESQLPPANSQNSDFSFPCQTSTHSPPSPARHSFSGIPLDRTDGSLISDGCTLPASTPVTPEHRLRPPSSAMLARSRRLSPLVKELPTVEIPSERSSTCSRSSEEFHSPQASSSLGDYLSGESQPPSAEKGRSKFRVKMNLQGEFSSVKSRRAFDVSRKENSMGPLFPPALCPVDSLGDDAEGLIVADYSGCPNLLSEELVRCMISIYCHLADPAVVTPPALTFDRVPSPTSPLGHVASSSFSSFSESSLFSVTRSPLVDLRSKDELCGNENSLDPYKSRGRLPWADSGAYSKALEVPWMSVREDQLCYAAQALHRFRSLVEQLPLVKARTMSHTEKLAFWINLFNALMMHAFLAYGVPRNDLKHFSLLQKAAYNVGGHTFSAAMIEFSLLRGKPPSYRPQFGLLMALHRSKFHLTDEQSAFAIDYPEPQMAFALCCGARSSPAVRVFTAGGIHKELNMALRDYARASVGLSPKGKLLIPKLLYSYAREFLEDGNILDWVCQLLPLNQAALVMEFWQQRQHRILGARKFEVIPFDFNFRYLFGPNFDKLYD